MVIGSRIRFTLVFLLLAGGILLAVKAARQGPPASPLEKAVAALVSPASYPEKQRAREVLWQFPDQAVAPLSRTFARKNFPGRSWLQSAVQHAPSLHLDFPDRNPQRLEALGLLAECGPGAASALPLLLKSLAQTNDVDEEPIRLQVAVALSKIASETNAAVIVPHLGLALGDPAPRIRVAAAESLGKIGLRTAKAIEPLTRSLKDPQWEVRVAAARALWRINHETATVLPTLIEALEQPDVSWQAAYALSDMGPAAAPATPTLIKAMDRERVPQPFRSPPSSVFALGKIGLPALPALTPLFGSEKVHLRVGALMAVGFMGPAANAVVPEVLPLLQDHSGEVRQAAALTLGSLGSEDKRLVPALAKLLKAEDIYVRMNAATVLRKLEPEGNWVVAAE